MSPLRHLLLVAALVVAQLLAGAHAIGHAAGDDEALPTHACELCLATHNLASALPSLTALPPVIAARLEPAVATLNPRAALPAPLPVQGAPPAA